MSYCHLCQGFDNMRDAFHPHVANAMRQTVNASCLGPSTLEAGSQVSMRAIFDPTSGLGLKSATLGIGHGAGNAPSPFHAVLRATSE